MYIINTPSLPYAASIALRADIFKGKTTDMARLLTTRDACEAVARTQTFLSDYVHGVFETHPALEAEARARLGVAQEALAEVWASMPAEGITASDLESAVIAACSTTYVEAP